jgi:hypothetical protein
MSLPGKLQVAADGRITGPATLTYNHPFPCVNGRYGSGPMMGVVMHTMVGNLPGTIDTFNNSAVRASAHFGIGQDGEIHQFGPIGKGWIAWHAVDANIDWYGIEHADNRNPENPLTPAQIVASAQLFEVLSRFAGFPLQVTNNVRVGGYATHVMGGVAWNPDSHTCPGPGPRAGQRAQIVALAMAIRTPGNEAFDMANFTADQLTKIVQDAVESVETRNVLATAQLWWLDQALAGTTPPGASPAQAALLKSITASLARLAGTAAPAASGSSSISGTS